MPIDALPFLDRTSETFRGDVDQFFLVQLPTWSAQLTAVEANINAKEISTGQKAQAAGVAAGMAADSASAANQSDANAAAHAASAWAAAVAAGANAGLPENTPQGGLLKLLPNGVRVWALPSPADFGLDQVDNTRDQDKPVSTPQAAALLPKAGGVATALGQGNKDHGLVPAGATVIVNVNEASVHRMEAAGAIKIQIEGWAGGNISQEVELHCVNFGGKAQDWLSGGDWVKADKSRVSVAGNAGINWLANGQNDVIVRHDFNKNVYTVM